MSIATEEPENIKTKKRPSVSLVCGIESMTQMNLFTKQKQTPTHIENKLMVTKGERGWGRDKLGVWD